MTGLLCTRLNKLPSEVGAESWPDVVDLFDYWKPPPGDMGRMAKMLEGVNPKG